MCIGRVGPDNHDHIRFIDRIEILGSGRRPEGGLQTIAGWRMADPRASIDVVVPETRANEFLDEVGLFIGTARGRNGTDRILAVFRLDAFEFGRRIGKGLVPRDSRQGSLTWVRIIGFRIRSLWLA